jgi:hypothetical protein
MIPSILFLIKNTSGVKILKELLFISSPELLEKKELFEYE